MESDKIWVQKSGKAAEEEEDEYEDKDEIFTAIEEEKGNRRSESEEDEIMKELRKVKRQNTITHCLLTAMILVTLTWQVSEVSLILRIKQGLKNPFKSLGGLVMKKILPKQPPPAPPGIGLPGGGESSDQEQQNSHLTLKLPDFLGFDSSDDD